jgi:hypothetical protein
MELGKYIRAMRPKKYLTREFKVYDASMADENTIDTMSTDAPPMDNVMPYTDGLEDPRNRQLELADGGIVEREGFNKGSEAKELRKLIESDKDKFTKKFNPFLKKYFPANLEKASEYLNIKSPRIRGLHKRRNIPLDTNRKKLSRKFVEGGMDVRGFRKEMATDLNFKEKIVKKLGSDSGYVDVNELGRKFGINLKEKKQKDYFLLVLKKLNIKSRPNPGQAQSKLYQVSDSVKKIIKNPVQKISGITKSGSERIVSEKKLDPDLFKFRNTLKQITREVTDKEGYKLDTKTGEKAQRIEDVGHSVSLKEATKYPKLFKNSNTLSLQSLIYQDPKLNRDILSKLGIDSSYSKIFKELNSFVGKKITPENQKTIRQLNKDMSNIRERAIKLIKEEAKRKPYFVGQEKRIPLIKADIPQVGGTFKSENLKADMSVVDEYYRFGQPNQINPNVNKFKDFTETEKLQYVENSSKQNADNVAKFFANVTDETTGRPVVPMNELNELKFSLETEINDNLKQYIKSTKILENFNVKEQLALTEFGNKVAMGFDPTDIIKALPEKEAQILKGVGSKIGNIAKLGARGAQELLVGTGPAGIGLTALISLPLAINELSEGARGSEAIQNTISDLTFGLTPRSDERIIKEIGGESAVKGMEIQKNIDDYRSITQEINNLENQMRDPSFLSLSPDDQDRIQSSLIQNEEALKEKENFLIPRININKKGEIESPEYEDYLKADNKRQLERELRLTGRNQESDINALTGEAAGQDQDQFNTLLDNRLLIDSLQKKYVGNQPKQTTYPSVMQGTVGEPVDNIINRNFAYAVGGRVEFKKGSKDKDSPVIPISPLTDLPQNESKRDFLKGIGAVGLGAVALGSGLLKLGKAAAPISEITKIVKGTTAPSWMDSLITKILKEGIELKSDPNSNVLIKKVKFKNPKTGVEEEATLTFDKQKNSYEIEYSSDETVGGKYGDKVFLKVEPEYAYDPQLQKMVPTGKHKFNAIEAEPEIVNPDGDIEMTGENVASKIIDLRSDISGLKSYVTGGKGIDKKIVKEKEALVKRAEEDPLADIEDNPRYSPRHYDLDEFSN